MQQSKPPIAAKPKIPASRRFAGKVMLEVENDSFRLANSDLNRDFEKKLTFSCNGTTLKSSSQSFENLYTDLSGMNKFCDEANVVIGKYKQSATGNSQVQQMKSKLFAKQQSEVSKTNPVGSDLSTATNKIHQEKYSKELEKILAMRKNQHSNCKNEKALKRLSRSFDESLSEASVANASCEIKQKGFTAELKHVQSEIKKKVIEHVSVQQRYEEHKVAQTITIEN